MISESELDSRLHAWSREYGWGGMPGRESPTGIIQRLIEHRGFVPSVSQFNQVPVQTLADEVEDAVRDLQKTLTEPGTANPYYRAAMVLRSEYTTPTYRPEAERLSGLERIGIRISRHTYYRSLQFGRAFLMGRLFKRSVA